MARFGFENPDAGSLTIASDAGQEQVTFALKPLSSALKKAQLPPETSPVLGTLDFRTSRFTIYPKNTLLSQGRFLQPKYNQIKSFDLPFYAEDYDLDRFVDEYDLLELFEHLPKGLSKDFRFGLGVPRDYKPIITTIESLTSATSLTFDEETGLVGDTFRISQSTFASMTDEIDRIIKRANAASLRVRETWVHNVIAKAVGAEEKPLKRGRHPLVQQFTDEAAGAEPLEDAAIDALIYAAGLESARIADEKPERLGKLRGDIELLTLDSMIDRFTNALTIKTTEPFWQKFFTENPFALHMALGYPVAIVQGQASVGGMKLRGSGNKIADFLAKNPLTDNVALIEIKKPGTALLRKKPFREDVYGPSNDLTASIVQVLDQRYRLQTKIDGIRAEERELELETFAVKACLIVGTTPEVRHQKKSFELFRSNSQEVTIVTYDEVLSKLKQLRELLRDET